MKIELSVDKKIENNDIYRVSQTTRISRISQKLSAADKNISDESCKVSSNALHGNISLTLNSYLKVT